MYFSIIEDIILTILLAYILGFLYSGLSRNIVARVHGRFGPPLNQTFIDSIKLFLKKESRSFGVMFYFGPLILTTGSVMTLLFVPLFNDKSFGVAVHGDLILVLYLMVLGSIGNALAIGVSGNPFGVLGVARGLSRLMGLELPFHIALIGIMIASSSSDIFVIINSQENYINALQHPFLFIAMLFSVIGFLGASPFDVVQAPQEVYSGPLVEFSGKFLAIAMSQHGVFLIAKLILISDLFLGGIHNIFDLIFKTFSLFLFALFVSIVYPRFKTAQTVNFLIKYPTIIGLIGLLYVSWF